VRSLRWTLSVAERSDLYSRKLPKISKEIRSLEDLSLLPFTTKTELRQAYPYGAVSAPLDDLAYFIHSSGTSGKPVAIFFTQKDLERLEVPQMEAFRCCGLEKGDRAQLIVHASLALLFQNPLQRTGVLSVLSGIGNHLGQLSLIKDLGITTVFGIPSYLLHLGELGKEGDLSTVKRVVTLGEPLTETMRRKIEGEWGCEVYDDYGSVELGAGFLECGQHDGHHVLADSFLFETVDPETGEQSEGEGELVFTTLTREATPLIRYRTGDFVRIEYDGCACGRDLPRIHVIRRLGEMVKIKGSAVYPSVIEETLESFNEILNFQAVASKDGALDRLSVRIEAKRPDEDLAERIAAAVKAATNVLPVVEFAPRGSLAGERKTKRFLDLRHR